MRVFDDWRTKFDVANSGRLLNKALLRLPDASSIPACVARTRTRLRRTLIRRQLRHEALIGRDALSFVFDIVECCVE